MKKVIVAILSILYISTATGATIHMHYCMGKLINWSLLKKEGDQCGKCGMKKAREKNNGCCKDEHKFVKNITDQKAAESALQLIHVLAYAVPSVFAEMPAKNFSSVTEENPLSHAPPRSSGAHVYILNCVFRL